MPKKPTKSGSWQELKERVLPRDEIAEVEENARKRSRDLDLRAIRKAAGLSGGESRKLLRKAEREAAQQPSKLAYYSRLYEEIRALGGEMQLVVEINGKQIPLSAESWLR
jgi:hypothetical protein